MGLDIWVPALCWKSRRPQRSGRIALHKGEDTAERVNDENGSYDAIQDPFPPERVGAHDS